jgi:serpin B
MNDPEAKLRSALSTRAAKVDVDDPGPRVRRRIVVRRRRHRQRVAFGSAALALLVAIAVLVPVINSTHHTTPTALESTGASPGVLRSQLVRDTRPAVPASALKRLTEASTQTALDLYGQLSRTQGNVFFSPYSIETALAMAAAGARGQTLSQMSGVLHNRLSPSQFQDATNALNLALLAPRPQPDPSASGQPLQLAIANSEWSQSGYPILPSFLDRLATDYGAALNTSDFAGHNAAALAAINGWVAQHTKGKIKHLFESLDPITKLVLVNAVYFKASWEFPFDPGQTQTGSFTTAGGGTVTVPFMHGTPSGKYASGAGWQAVDVPYVGNASMTIVMPDAGSFSSFDRSFDASKLAMIVDGLQPSDLSLTMPKFEMEDSADLVPALKALGMTDAFTNADFSGITNPSELEISQVVHQATITVDEKGTEAAAATGISLEDSAARGRAVALDHPFLYFIRDTKTGAILFMGRVTDPTQTSVQQP